MRMNRRRALAALSGLAAAGLTGCSAERPLRVAVVWSGWELARFRRVLEGEPVTVYSAGNDIAALLRKPVAPAATPDVAIVPQPGLIRDPEIRSRLQPLTSQDPSFWRDLVTGPGDGQAKGVWFKVAYKSLVWYRPEAVASPPTGWEAWWALCRDRAASGRPPLSVPAADGWALTDWFENVLLGHAPDLYGRLHLLDPADWGDERVAQAFIRLACLWSIPGLVPGGGRRALVTQFHDAILDVFRYGRADMVAGPDFAWPVIDRYRSPGREARWFRFPCSAGERPPLLVGGDAVVALASSEERGERFVARLTGGEMRERLAPWARAGGFLSLGAGLRDDDYPAPVRPLARELRELRELRGLAESGKPGAQATGRSIAFDLSDQLGGALAGGDGQGLWRILTDLFAAVAVDPCPPGKAEEAARTAHAAAVEAAASRADGS
ncbi:hypothetical protein [Streptosporangium pseudovulgare]|uniref:Sugar ABC transporter substrate-binding protein n=1 Tax=Streptosporangium pseudovulgare TaxID=35765 RepID=A0ABQ2R8Z2_9ACTN|nr:hypothetical protein [Streptosporangium pseudovulgare]GGQ17112.1 sugar ABC transporter substrate-binding protein [Streptosporangium pseudovulgare]